MQGPVMLVPRGHDCSTYAGNVPSITPPPSVTASLVRTPWSTMVRCHCRRVWFNVVINIVTAFHRRGVSTTTQQRTVIGPSVMSHHKLVFRCIQSAQTTHRARPAVRAATGRHVCGHISGYVIATDEKLIESKENILYPTANN